MENAAITFKQDGNGTPRMHVADSNAGLAIPVTALQSEGTLLNLSIEDLSDRQELIGHLRKIPKESLHYMRHFQPQIGCLNRCSFCSQSAGTTLWNLSRKDLANLIAAIKTVSLEWAIEDGSVGSDPINSNGVFSRDFKMPQYGLIGNKRNDRPGVIYCYLDNDPAAYPHLDDLIQWLNEDLGVHVRIATVGYSRLNHVIQGMHERISANLMDGIAGLRLSFSPYTYGWTAAAERVGAASRYDFEHDLANMLRTYRDAFISSQNGRKGNCVELRFKPLVVKAKVEVLNILGRLVISSGPYLVIQKSDNRQIQLATITDAKDHSNELSIMGEPCWIIHSCQYTSCKDIETLVVDLLNTSFSSVIKHCSTGLLHKLANEDGEYFGVNVERTFDGVKAKYFYPESGKRPGSGYIDGERYLLNQLIAATNKGKNISWKDADEILDNLKSLSDTLSDKDPVASHYILEEVVTVVDSYIRVLKLAAYPSKTFFDKRTSVDTGHICNLGRAYREYKSIASRPNLPLTPNHERAFGVNGELAEEGLVWRLSVVPVQGGNASPNARGERNIYKSRPSILLEKLDLADTATSQGQSKGQYFLSVTNIERVSILETKQNPLIPGHNSGTSI
mgnify:CR=1 FL=1